MVERVQWEREWLDMKQAEALEAFEEIKNEIDNYKSPTVPIVCTETTTSNPNALDVINLHELINTEWPEEVFIGGGLLSRGDRMLLGADSKAGKSTLLVQLLRNCCSAKPFLGFAINKPLKVLFMQAELRESRLKERMKATSFKLSVVERERFTICSTRGMVMLTDEWDMARVEATLDNVRPDIWCIDPMANFHDRDENSSTEMMNFFRLLDKVKEKHNLAVIMSTHFRKASTQKPLSVLSMIRGSSALRGWADTNLAIEGNQGDKVQHLEFELRNSDKIHKRMLIYDKNNREFQWEDPIVECGKWAIEYIGDGEVKTTVFIKDMIKLCGDKVSHNKTKAYKVKEQLVHDGVLEEIVDGKHHFLRGLKRLDTHVETSGKH